MKKLSHHQQLQAPWQLRNQKTVKNQLKTKLKKSMIGNQGKKKRKDNKNSLKKNRNKKIKSKQWFSVMLKRMIQ
jgi:hypothetical protein